MELETTETGKFQCFTNGDHSELLPWSRNVFGPY